MGNFNNNVLVLIGLALFLGTAAAHFLKKIKVPGIVGFILTGLLIGQSGFRLIDSRTIQLLGPFNYFALALIGFTIGGELRKEVFKKYGRALLRILAFEGLGAFICVFVLTAACGLVFLNDVRLALSLALMLGAIASATDPASPVSIIWETKSRGPLTTSILGIVALDDGLALLLFAAASAAAVRILKSSPHANGLLFPVYEITAAVALGILAGLLLVLAIDRLNSKEALAGLSFGLIVLTAGISIAAGLDMILAVMSSGVAVVNLRPEKSRQIFRIVKSATGPIFILFFVNVGASIDIGRLTAASAYLTAAYLAGMVSGKIFGTRIGAKSSNAPAQVYSYLPYCLFAQAGVAVGLTILASQEFPGQAGQLMILIITPSVFLLQLLAPVATRISLQKAGETGLSVTEEDLLETVTVGELRGYETPPVREDTPIDEIMEKFSSGDNFYYPVIKHSGELIGIVSVEGLKSTLMEQELRPMLLAADIMEPVPAAIDEESSLTEARNAMDKYAIEFIPVTDNKGRLKGFLEQRTIKKYISSRLVEMRERASELEKEKTP